MLKRLLSTILTIAMILSLIPASFASAEDATAAAEVENVKIVYGAGATVSTVDTSLTKAGYYTDFISKIPDKTNYNTMLDYTLTNGFWMFGGYKSSGETGWDVTYNRTDTMYFTYGKAQLGYWHGLKFHVPVSGTYDMTLYAYSDVASGVGTTCRFAYTVVPESTSASDIDKLMENVSWTTTDAKTGEGTLTAPNDKVYILNAIRKYTGTGNNSDTQKVTFDQAGDYILILQNVECNPTKTTTTEVDGEEVTVVDEWSASKILLQGFSLTKGENPTSVPMGITSLTASEITTGETTTASYGTLYGSGDWAAYDTTNSTITYVSSNEKVATVDADGNVTGKGAGTAEISAVVDGAQLVSAPITVEAPSVKIVYDVGYLYTATIENQGETDYATEIGAGFGGYSSSDGTQRALNLDFTDYDTSNGFWRYIGHTSAANPITFYGCWSANNVNVGDWFAIGINVPVAGKYDLALTGYRADSKSNSCDFAYRIFPAGTTATEIETAMKDVAYNEDETTVNGEYLGWRQGGTLNTSPNVHEAVQFAEAGEYIFVAKTLKHGIGSLEKRLIVDYITLTQSDKTGILPIGYTKLSANEITIGATAQAAKSDKLYNANDWGTYDATGKTVTYASSDPNVATVDAATGVITAKALGTAEITATVDGAQLAPATITVTKYASAPKALSLWVESDADDAVSVTVGGNAVSVGNVEAAAQGATVKVTANDTETHRFSHWLGTAGIASFDSEYTFNIYTNTALKAVYEEIPDEAQAVVSFYKPNRELFATKVVGKNTLFSAAKPATDVLSLVGYNTFLGWALGEDEDEQPIMVEDNYEITGDLGVVAVFDGKKMVENFKVGSNEAAKVPYGQEFNEHSTGGDNFSYWKRNDHIVSYNQTYTFYAWQDNAEIKSVVSGYEEAKPVAILESYDTDTWMFEYEIPANCTRLEAGIIFGNSSDITIDSCYARAVSRRGAEDKHGQFTASSDYACAKGYIIFKDSSNKTCVVYSE